MDVIHNLKLLESYKKTKQSKSCVGIVNNQYYSNDIVIFVYLTKKEKIYDFGGKGSPSFKRGTGLRSFDQVFLSGRLLYALFSISKSSNVGSEDSDGGGGTWWRAYVCNGSSYRLDRMENSRWAATSLVIFDVTS